MKLLLLVLCLALSSCVTTTTRNPDGSSTTVSRQDPKVIAELEPLVQAFGAGAVQGALQSLQSRSQP